MNPKKLALASALGVPLLSGSMGNALAQDDFFVVPLTGFQEVLPVSTAGNGTFVVTNTEPVKYELNYDLEGEIIQAHIHFGQPGVNGGIMLWLCANPAFLGDIDPPFGTPDCGGQVGTVIGELTAADVVGPANQSIEPGDGAAAVAAVRAGAAYVNVHSDLFPGGEIRGQLRFHGIEDRWEILDDLRDRFDHHTHTYLTGKGEGHNNTEATTSDPDPE